MGLSSSARRIVIEFLGQDKSLGKTLKGVNDKTTRFGTIAAKAGRVAAYGLGAGLVVAATAAVKFTQAAMEDEAAASLMAEGLRNSADATKAQIAQTEAWITTQGRLLGVTDDELRPAIARLATATGDVTKAQELARLAMDVSAGTGKSLEQVSTALMKAENGQVSALSRLGIKTKDASGETITMDQATKRMSDTFGGAASEKANTLSGKIDRLKLMFSEAGESLGSKLLPYVERFADFVLNTAVPNIEKFIRQMENGRGEGGRFADKLDHLKEVVKKVGKFVIEHKEDIGKLVIAYLAAKEATKVWTTAQLLLNVALSANPIGLVIIAIAGLAGGFFYAYKKSEQFREAVGRIRREFIDSIGRAAAFAFAIKTRVIDSMASAIGFVGRLVGAFVSMWTRISGILADFGGALDDVRGKIESLLGRVSDLPGGLGGLLGAAVGRQFGEGFASGLKSKAKWIATAWAHVTGPMVEALTDQLNSARDALASARDRRNSFADFSGFTGNLFGADISGEVGSRMVTSKNAKGEDVETKELGPTGVGALRAFAAAQAASAKQLADDTAKLTSMGISQALLDDLKSQGASGLAQIHALASASQAEANEIFANMAAANALNQQAGQTAASLMDASLRNMGAGVSGLAATLQAYINAPKQPIAFELVVNVGGKTVRQSLLADARANGRPSTHVVTV